MESSLIAMPESLAELPALSESLIAASQPYVGQWNRLVSTTNWEKGRLIANWRQQLIADGLAVADYSDEAWSRLVGGVSGQHVGRLRRVFQRFGQMREHFPNLYWSHFQAALDWNDAEMWLQGAESSGWSVAQMRAMRWETMGRVEADQPRPEDIIDSEPDGDFEPARDTQAATHSTGPFGDAGPRFDGPDFGDEPGGDAASGSYSPIVGELATAVEPVELVRPFEDLPELPDDLAEAFDAMKLAILRHKTDGWRAISASDIMRTLDALKALVTAPTEAAAL